MSTTSAPGDRPERVVPASGPVNGSQAPVLDLVGAWRERADRAVAIEQAWLDGVDAVARSVIAVDGDAEALVLRVECTLTSEIVPIGVMLELDDELPARLERTIGLPLVERHLDLSIRGHAGFAA